MHRNASPGDGTRAVGLRPGRLALLLGVVSVAVLILGVAKVGAQEEDRFDNEYCLGCHAQPGLELTLTNGEVLDLSVDPDTFAGSVHGRSEIPCVLCHTSIEGFPHEPLEAASYREYVFDQNQTCEQCHLEQFTATLDNVHGDVLGTGNLEAAVCSDCHGAHDAQTPVAHSPEVPVTCRACHSEIYDLYAESVHGEALATGNRDVPTCTDCHGVHNLDGPAPDSPFHLFSPQICAECHADEDLMGQYGISTGVFDTYVADFHGSTVVLFEQLAPDQETNKPVCIDCHGVHAIKAEDDPNSTVFRENLLRTCQRCHPDASDNFPASWLSHYEPSLDKAPVVFGVNLFYKIIIPVVIGGMALFVVLDGVRHRIDKRRRADG
jgi:hypothetical protein